MKRILVPTDFSKNAHQALATAISLAKQVKANVCLIHVHKMVSSATVDAIAGVSVSYSIPEQDLEDIRVQHHQKLQKLIDECKLAGVEAEAKLLMDYSVGSLDVEPIIKEKADLIIVGTRGHSLLEDIVIGSTTLSLVRSSSIPVLAVKKKPISGIIDSVVWPVAIGEQDEDISAVHKIQHFLLTFRPKVHLCYVHVPGAVGFVTSRQAAKMGVELGERYKLQTHTFDIINDLTEEQGIQYCADKYQADLIIMPTHGRSGLERFFKGSIAEEVIKSSACAILTVNMGAK